MAPGHPLDRFIHRLAIAGPLADADRQAILDLPVTLRSVAPATYLMREGEPPISCAILVSGYAFRHKITGAGARQIVSLHIPGEALDLQSVGLTYVDHNIQTLTHADLAVVPVAALRELMVGRPAITGAVLAQVLIEGSMFREWVVNVGRRSARERLAHLLCEFACRLDAQGLSDGDGYELPMTQEQIGDALGLTSVHVNRSIKALSEEGLLSRKGRLLHFPNIRRLREVGDFSELYLHLQQRHA